MDRRPVQDPLKNARRETVVTFSSILGSKIISMEYLGFVRLGLSFAPVIPGLLE